jgi:proteasome lid subunit RPN8/RPN11
MLQMSQETVDAIIAHARAEAPIEACGYLAEQESVVVRHYPLTNRDASPEHFSLSPEEQFAAVRSMRAAGLRLRAIYHSHPASEARPSAEDIKLAYDPDISYVIVSLKDGNAAVRSFRIRAALVEQEDVEIVPVSPVGSAPQENNRQGRNRT